MEQEPQRLSWPQICERYPDEWVVLVETECADDAELESSMSTVLGHFKSRTQASPYIKAAVERYREVGSFWTGAMAMRR